MQSPPAVFLPPVLTESWPSSTCGVEMTEALMSLWCLKPFPGLPVLLREIPEVLTMISKVLYWTAASPPPSPSPPENSSCAPCPSQAFWICTSLSLKLLNSLPLKILTDHFIGEAFPDPLHPVQNWAEDPSMWT